MLRSACQIAPLLVLDVRVAGFDNRVPPPYVSLWSLGSWLHQTEMQLKWLAGSRPAQKDRSSLIACLRGDGYLQSRVREAVLGRTGGGSVKHEA